jgi:hypothetical protein
MFTRTKFSSHDTSNYADNDDDGSGDGSGEEDEYVSYKPAYRGEEYKEEAEVLNVNNEEIEEIFIETEPQ